MILSFKVTYLYVSSLYDTPAYNTSYALRPCKFHPETALGCSLHPIHDPYDPVRTFFSSVILHWTPTTHELVGFFP